MQAGAYKNKIEIQKVSNTYDNIGNPKQTWKKVHEGYAYINGLSGKEYWEAASIQQENTLEFVFRWKKFFNEMDTTRYRLRFNGKIYNIHSIDNIQFRNKTVKIRAVCHGNK